MFDPVLAPEFRMNASRLMLLSHLCKVSLYLVQVSYKEMLLFL